MSAIPSDSIPHEPKVEQSSPQGSAGKVPVRQPSTDEGRISHAADEASNRREAELSEAQKRAAVLMAQGMLNTEIARHCGLEAHTISRWKHNEAFMRLVKVAGDAMDLKTQADRMEFMAQLAALKLEALPVLRELLRDEEASIRLKAAEAISKL